MKKLLLATNNHGKFQEMADFLKDLPFELLSLRDFEEISEPEEIEPDLYGNALLKARYYREIFGIPTLSDDSGVFVEALAGELGVKTRRFGAGATASDSEWVEFFLNRMKREENRRAKFQCVMAFCDEGVEKTFFGECEGEITRALEAPIIKGIPLSSCFKPSGCDLVFAALSEEKKNEVSHRGRALRAVLEFLREFKI
jgi:XTP/dITP diphosphohydrolase